MKSFGSTIVGLAAAIGAGMFLMSDAQAQGTPAVPAVGDGSVHAVTYLEVRPSAVKSGTGLLQAYRDSARKQAGSLGVEVFQEIGRGNRLAIRAGWRDQKALEASAKTDAATTLNSSLKAVQLAPVDERLHDAYGVGAGPAKAGAGTIYVLTHVDVPPPKLAELEPLLKALAEASRKDSGAVRFDVLQQSSRKNHFTVVEAWRDMKAFEAHQASAAGLEFRAKLGTMLGALYDQRLYKQVE